MGKDEDKYLHCPIYGGQLIWSSDFNAYEVSGLYEEDDEAIASYYTCSECGRSIEIIDPPKEERSTSYKDYWNEN